MDPSLFNLPEFPDSSTCKQSLQVALAQLPEGVTLLASGRWARVPTMDSHVPTRYQETGGFTDCTIRRLPDSRVFEFPMMPPGGDFIVTIPELIESAQVIA